VRAQRSVQRAGRPWAVEAVVDWWRSQVPTMTVLGAPGTGKTALVKTVIEGRYDTGRGRIPVHANHLCDGPVVASTDPRRVLASIGGQLARTVPGYAVCTGLWTRDTDQDQNRQVLLAAMDSATVAVAYDRILRQPLRALAAGQRLPGDVLLVIDGIDETLPAGPPGGLADLFAEQAADPVPGLRTLMTLRSDPERRLSGGTVIDLSADPGRDAAGINEHLAATLDLAAGRRAAIAEAASGSYLYADLAGRLAVAGMDIATLTEHGCDLDAVYSCLLERVGDPASLARRALEVLGRARGRGLTAARLAAVLGTGTRQVTLALQRVPGLLRGGRELRPYHRCLSEYLARQGRAVSAIDWAIADTFAGYGSGHWSRCQELYPLRNLLVHLTDAARPGTAGGPGRAALEAVAKLVDDPSFVLAALCRTGVADLLTALSYVERGGAMPYREGISLARLVRRQAATLYSPNERPDRALVAQQLGYETANAGVSQLANGVAEWIAPTGILTLWATHDRWLSLGHTRLVGHNAAITHLAVTPDGTRGISASRDGVTRMWRLASGIPAYTRPATTPVTALHPVPDGRVVASTSDGQAQVWDTNDGTHLAQIPGGRSVMVSAFAISADGSCAISGDLDGNATVWDLRQATPILRLPCRAQLLTAVAMAPTGRYAATNSLDGLVTLWDVASAVPLAQFATDPTTAALALAPDGDRLFVGGDGFAVYALRGPACGQTIARLTTHYRVTALAVNPTMPQYVLFGTSSGQVAYVQAPHLGDIRGDG
jgi:hypothetical protein